MKHLFIAMLPCLALMFAPLQAHASTGVITGSKDNYIANVCRKAGELWSIPAMPNQGFYRVEVEFSIDSSGKPESCSIRTPSGFDAFDLSACKALMRVSDFGMPPGRRPVLLTLEFSNARQPANAAPHSEAPSSPAYSAPYSEAPSSPAYSAPKTETYSSPSQTPRTGRGVISHIRPTINASKELKEYTLTLWEHIHKHMWIPDSLPEGRYDCTLRLTLDSRGNIVQTQMLVSTKVGALDNVVLSNAKKASPLPAPPKGLGSRFNVPLSMVKTLR